MQTTRKYVPPHIKKNQDTKDTPLFWDNPTPRNSLSSSFAQLNLNDSEAFPTLGKRPATARPFKPSDAKLEPLKDAKASSSEPSKDAKASSSEPSKDAKASSSEPSKNAKPSFSELSKEWARKKKEEEENAKQEAEKEAERLRNKKEMEESIKLGTSMLYIKTKKNESDDEKELDIGCHVSDDSLDDEPYASDDFDDQEEDDGGDEQYDVGWNDRRHRDDLY
jgi:hypothetical protein